MVTQNSIYNKWLSISYLTINDLPRFSLDGNLVIKILF